jgi:hypothetical protein
VVVRFAKYLQVDYTLDVVPTDPDGSRVLECALKAGSDTGATGDTDLLVMGSFVPSARLRRHSARNASIGSRRAARRAGR